MQPLGLLFVFSPKRKDEVGCGPDPKRSESDVNGVDSGVSVHPGVKSPVSCMYGSIKLSTRKNVVPLLLNRD